MKRLLVVLLLLTSFALGQAAAPATSQPAPPSAQGAQTMQPPVSTAKPEDVKSMDSIIAAVYDVISGPVDKDRDWDRFKSLFVPGARLIPTVKPPSSPVYMARVLTPDEFATRSGQGMKQSGNGFFEKEIARRTEQWGNIAQVFSTYESRRAPGDQPFARGINSFQLMNDGQRWWIVTIFWEGENKDAQLTPEFLKSPK